MPVNHRIDSKGHYFQWGNHGKKYYFNPKNQMSIDKAYGLTIKQAHAIFWRKSHSF
jgi:hypothetical protein